MPIRMTRSIVGRLCDPSWPIHQPEQAATAPGVFTAGAASPLRSRKNQVRRRKWIVLAGLLAACGGVWAFDAWRLRAEWRQAQREVTMGRYASAFPRLEALSRRWPGEAEVHFDLGLCEQALGHPDRADKAWSEVRADSPFAGQAAVMRARLALLHHQLSVAEELMPA